MFSKKLWLNFDVLSNTDHSLFSSNSWLLAIPIIFTFRRRWLYTLAYIECVFYNQRNDSPLFHVLK